MKFSILIGIFVALFPCVVSAADFTVTKYMGPVEGFSSMFKIKIVYKGDGLQRIKDIVLNRGNCRKPYFDTNLDMTFGEFIVVETYGCNVIELKIITDKSEYTLSWDE